MLAVGADAPAPSGPISDALREQFLRNAESSWFRAKANLAAALRGEKTDWAAFMKRLESAEFREYDGLKEALRSVGYADKAASGG